LITTKHLLNGIDRIQQNSDHWRNFSACIDLLNLHIVHIYSVNFLFSQFRLWPQSTRVKVFVGSFRRMLQTIPQPYTVLLKEPPWRYLVAEPRWTGYTLTQSEKIIRFEKILKVSDIIILTPAVEKHFSFISSRFAKFLNQYLNQNWFGSNIAVQKSGVRELNTVGSQLPRL